MQRITHSVAITAANYAAIGTATEAEAEVTKEARSQFGSAPGPRSTMEVDEDWKKYLRPTLQMLALSSDAQARANGPGCPTCDMSEDFDLGREFALQTGNLSIQQVALLNRINDLLQSMKPSDNACSNPKALDEPVWANVRSVAHRALLEFGWDADDLPPFVEIQPGVWQQKEKKAQEPNLWLRQLLAIVIRVRNLFREEVR